MATKKCCRDLAISDNAWVANNQYLVNEKQALIYLNRSSALIDMPLTLQIRNNLAI